MSNFLTPHPYLQKWTIDLFKNNRIPNIVYKKVSTPTCQNHPPITRIPPPHSPLPPSPPPPLPPPPYFLKSSIPPPYWQIDHPKFSFINRNETVKLNSINTIHVKQRYKTSGNPVKNHGKKPRGTSPCKETRKRWYITRRNVFLPGLN